MDAACPPESAMSTESAAVTFQYRDPRKVNMFWVEALGLRIAATADSGSTAVPATIPLSLQAADALPAYRIHERK